MQDRLPYAHHLLCKTYGRVYENKNVRSWKLHCIQRRNIKSDFIPKIIRAFVVNYFYVVCL